MKSSLLDQLSDQKLKVDFDSYDITVRELVAMVSARLIDIAPEYQRQFRWEKRRQSSFVESLFLGIPIPSLFTAANSDGTWELIDGVQRLSTLVSYTGDTPLRESLGIEEQLRLTGIEKLDSFNGTVFNDLPVSIQTQFLLRPLKVITVSDKSDYNVRFDLFERLNSGGVMLTDQEIRSCIFRGAFGQFLRDVSEDDSFRSVVRLPQRDESNGTREEFALRFFAFLHRYRSFDHSVVGFLNDYMRDADAHFDYGEGREIFRNTFLELSKLLPNGITRGRKTTPVNLYEGVAVGAALALRDRGRLMGEGIEDWMQSPELRKYTTGATNSNPVVKNRIDFCYHRFLGELC